MNYLSASESDIDLRQQISCVFVEGFYQWLYYFSKSKKRLALALAHMFILERFFVAMEDGKIAAITACTDGKSAPIHLEKPKLKRHLGFVRGTFAYAMLKKNLQEHGYPFALAEDSGSIEFVATAAEYRNKGVAYVLIEHVMATRPYKHFVLEVADTNEAAMRLYQRLGFTEFKRVKAPSAKISGVNFFVYMGKGL